jgi:hypothetical protein
MNRRIATEIVAAQLPEPALFNILKVALSEAGSGGKKRSPSYHETGSKIRQN